MNEEQTKQLVEVQKSSFDLFKGPFNSMLRDVANGVPVHPDYLEEKMEHLNYCFKVSKKFIDECKEFNYKESCKKL